MDTDPPLCAGRKTFVFVTSKKKKEMWDKKQDKEV